MRVITFGRKTDNDVVLNDPFVGRHHCQIVQHDDGRYTIVDLGSINGTFVNGQRIFGEVRLNPNDQVRIGYTTLPWRNYFGAVVPPPKKTNALPIVLGVVGGVVALVAVIVLLTVRFGGVREKDIYFTGDYPPVAPVTFEQNGYIRSIEAVQGQVMVYFSDNISHSKAVSAIHKAGGEVVAQIPKAHYYLVSTREGEESSFMHNVGTYADIDFVYPNAVSYPCAARPHVIDNFKTKLEKYDAPHGKVVSYAIEICGTNASVSTFDAGVEGELTVYFSEAIRNMEKLLSDNTREDALVINLSFGSALKGKYWDFASDSAKKDYVIDYVNDIIVFTELIKAYDDKDFVIVKSAGNAGIKEFGKEIIVPLYDSLKKRNLIDVMNRHILLVSAEDTREEWVCPTNEACTMKEAVNTYARYSNELEKGRYHPWVTKVDISDFKYKDQNAAGTSYASPRAACFISSVANSKNMKVTEVLQYARKATEKATGHILTQELLEKVIEEEKNKENVEDKQNGCLKYRLIYDAATDEEKLELVNTCDEDIRVTGYLLNKIAPHGGENTLDFETIVHANGMEYVEGFIENECTITKVEKEEKKSMNSSSTSTSSQNNPIPASLVGTKWETPQVHNNWTGQKQTLEFLTQYKIQITDEVLFYLISTSNTLPPPQIKIYDCCFDSKENRIIIDKRSDQTIAYSKMHLKYEQGRLFEITNQSSILEYEKMR